MSIVDSMICRGDRRWAFHFGHRLIVSPKQASVTYKRCKERLILISVEAALAKSKDGQSKYKRKSRCKYDFYRNYYPNSLG